MVAFEIHWQCFLGFSADDPQDLSDLQDLGNFSNQQILS